MPRYSFRAYFAPHRDLLAHVWVHNGPLWWACRDCRSLRSA